MSWNGAAHSLPLIGDPWKPPSSHRASESSPLLAAPSPPSAPFSVVASETGPSASTRAAAVLLLQSYCNAGVLLLPYGAQQAGLPGFLLFLTVVALFNLYTAHLLIWCIELTALINPLVHADGFQYSSLLRCIAGSRAHRGFLALECVDLFGLIVAELALIAESTQSLLVSTKLLSSNHHGLVCSMLAMGMLPLVLFRDPRASLWATMLPPLAAAVLGLAALAGCVSTRLAAERTTALPQGEGGVAEALPILLFCCLPHFSLFPIYTAVVGRDLPAMGAALRTALPVAFLCYLAWAVTAGLAWGSVPANALLALSDGSRLAAACQLTASIALLLTLPPLGAELQERIFALSAGHAQLSAAGHSAAAIALWGSVAFVAAHISEPVWFFKSLGATTSLALGGIVPLWLYLRVHQQTRQVAYLEHGTSGLPSSAMAQLVLLLACGAALLLAFPLLL